MDEAESVVHSLQRELSEKGDVQFRKYDDYREQTEKMLETLNEKVREQEVTIHEKEELVNPNHLVRVYNCYLVQNHSECL